MSLDDHALVLLPIPSLLPFQARLFRETTLPPFPSHASPPNPNPKRVQFFLGFQPPLQLPALRKNFLAEFRRHFCWCPLFLFCDRRWYSFLLSILLIRLPPLKVESSLEGSDYPRKAWWLLQVTFRIAHLPIKISIFPLFGPLSPSQLPQDSRIGEDTSPPSRVNRLPPHAPLMEMLQAKKAVARPAGPSHAIR